MLVKMGLNLVVLEHCFNNSSTTASRGVSVGKEKRVPMSEYALPDNSVVFQCVHLPAALKANLRLLMKFAKAFKALACSAWFWSDPKVTGCKPFGVELGSL